MNSYRPAQFYIWFGVAAVVLGGASAWAGTWFPLSYLATALFLLTAVLLFAAALRPPIEVHEGYLAIGKRIVPWMDIRRLDRTGWVSPLAVRITLFDDSRFVLIYPGDLERCNALLRSLRRFSRDALIDGVPYRQYWGEMSAGAERKQVPPPPRYRVLRPDDEAEVERLYQRLKTVGNLDQKNSTDEK